MTYHQQIIPFEPAQLRPRHDGWTAEKQADLIEALAATKCVDEACRSVGMSDTSAYELCNRPCGHAFVRAWDLALEYQLDRRLGIAAREFEGHKVEEVEGAPFSLNLGDVTFASRPAAPALLWRQLCEDC